MPAGPECTVLLTLVPPKLYSLDGNIVYAKASEILSVGDHLDYSLFCLKLRRRPILKMACSCKN